MKAICVTPGRALEIRDVPTPHEPVAEHVIVHMAASAINPGDKTFLRRAPPMKIAMSQHDVWGVSGAGTIVAIGDRVPPELRGKRVTVYRSLAGTEHTVGCWSEYAQLHVRSCCVIPDELDTIAYSGSLVNAITPYACWQQARTEGHAGILITAGTSATGIAMLGICRAYNIPSVSIARSDAGKRQLVALGATHVVVTEDSAFDSELRDAAAAARATAVFDGVGGELLTRIAPQLPRLSTVYSYGVLAGLQPFSLSSQLVMANSLTIKSFSNFGSPTVRDPQALAAALAELSRIIAMPHFQTKRGRGFAFAEIAAAMDYTAADGSKPILIPG